MRLRLRQPPKTKTQRLVTRPSAGDIVDNNPAIVLIDGITLLGRIGSARGEYRCGPGEYGTSCFCRYRCGGHAHNDPHIPRVSIRKAQFHDDTAIIDAPDVACHEQAVVPSPSSRRSWRVSPLYQMCAGYQLGSNTAAGQMKSSRRGRHDIIISKYQRRVICWSHRDRVRGWPGALGCRFQGFTKPGRHGHVWLLWLHDTANTHIGQR